MRLKIKNYYLKYSQKYMYEEVKKYIKINEILFKNWK